MLRSKRLSERALDGLDAEAFDDIADTHILIALERHAAFLAGLYLAHLILEAFESGKRSLMDDNIVADQADLRAALNGALGHAAAGNFAHPGNVEHLEDLRIAEERLAQGRCQEAGHHRLHVVDEIVNDIVVTHFDAGTLGCITGLLIGTDIEAEDDGAGCLGERNIAFADSPYTIVNNTGGDLIG